MRLLMQIFLLVWWGVLKQARADNFAAVAGTGWTDISQLQSTCGVPGYFVNPSDCSRFYVCVDHSTPEHKLLLRYDFDCPGGLAFDESTHNCNYPGPSGCVSGNSGWGWSKQPGSGIFQSTATVSREPNSWGTPTKYPVSTTVIQRPSSSGTIVRVPSTAAPLPSNPRLNHPSVHVIQIPLGTWESFRLRPATASGVFQSAKISGASSSETGGWSPTRVVTPAPGVFQSARVTAQPGQRPSVPWGSSKILPVEPGVFQSARVTPVPQTEWETPRPFPQTVSQPVRVVGDPGSGWSGNVRITPTPTPANPTVQAVTPSVVWHSQRISPSPPVSWQQITQVHQQQPNRLGTGWNAPQPSNPSLNFVQQSPPIASNPSLNYIPGGPVASNPSVNYIQGNPPVASNPSQTFIQRAPQPATYIPGNYPPVASNPSLNYFQGNPPVASNPTLNYIPGNPPVANNPSVNYIQGNPPVANNPSQSYIQRGPQSVTYVHPPESNPSVSYIQGNQTPGNNPSLNYVQSNAQTETVNSNEGNTDAGNPNSINAVHANPTVTIPAGWENNVRITPLPSGYIWQSVPNAKPTESETDFASTPVAPTLPTPPGAPSLASAGDYGIIQQVINEEQGQGNSDGKSHIHRVYESKEGQRGQYQSQTVSNQNQILHEEKELNSNDPSNPAYQIFASPDSGVKGRIIVLYAPLTRGGKREVPTIEVEVEEGEDNNDEGTENA